MKIRHLILPALALLLCSMPANRAIARELEESEKEVEFQIQAVIQAQSKDGYELAFPRTLDTLARGAQAPKTVLLYPTNQYSIVAVCDQKCEDIDLIIKDESGREVASDRNDDAVAVVTLVPPAEGRYLVSVRMDKCSTRGSCHFGLGVFIKRGENAVSAESRSN